MLELVLPAFLAGILTFLAPCTLPLVPGFLALIGGSSLVDLRTGATPELRRRVFLNGLLYVVGFSLVFILIGSLFGLGGSALLPYKNVLGQIGGAFLIFFGLSVLGIIRFPSAFFQAPNRILHRFTPGRPLSSFLLGATFAFGWTPCVGPVLGAVLTLATVSATVGQGAFLLGVFSLGLAIPFLTLAAAVSSSAALLVRYRRGIEILFAVGGILLIFLGSLLILNRFNSWILWNYETLDFIPWQKVLNYL